VIKEAFDAKTAELEALKHNQAVAIQQGISSAYSHALKAEQERVLYGMMNVLFPSASLPHNGVPHAPSQGYTRVTPSATHQGSPTVGTVGTPITPSPNRQ
jgi:hypothetical protein